MSSDGTTHNEPVTEPTPFEKFDAFTRRIMAVPKSEIDAKTAEQKAKVVSDKPVNLK